MSSHIFAKLMQVIASASHSSRIDADLADRLLRISESMSNEYSQRYRMSIRAASTPAFNARTLRVDNVIQIEVNLALVEHAMNVCALLGEIVIAESAGNWLRHEMDIPTARANFHAMTEGFVSGRASSTEQSQPTGARRDFARFLFDTLLDFVIAHEVSHIVLGHLDHHVRNGTDPVEDMKAAWSRELSADLVAMHALRRMAGTKVRLSALLQGPALFFEIVDALLEEAGRQSSNYDNLQRWRYPPAEARRSALVSDMGSQSFLTLLPEVDSIVEYMRALRS